MSQNAVPQFPPRRVPSRWWYAVAGLCFFAGFAAMAVFLVSRLGSIGDDLTQIVVPGERTLALTPGEYTIFHEEVSVVDGKVYQSDGIAGLAITVTAPDGSDVKLATPTVSATYRLGGRVGVAVLAFAAATPGDYTVAGAYGGGATGPETVIAVGAGFVSGLLWTIFGGLAFAFTGAGLAAAIGVTVLVKRRRAGLKV